MARVVKQLAVAAGAACVALALGEVALRLSSVPAFDFESARRRADTTVLAVAGDVWGARDDPDALDERANEPAHRLHPYFGWDQGDADDAVLRDVKQTRSKQGERSIDVVLFGGSVAAAMSQAFVPELVRSAAADPAWAGWSVRVFVHARAAFRQPQQTHALAYLLALGVEPDVVVSLDGFNELALGFQNAQRGVHPVMPSVMDWGPLATTAPWTPASLDLVAAIRAEQLRAQRWFDLAERFGLFHSALATRFVQARLGACQRRHAQAAHDYEVIEVDPRARTFHVGPRFDASTPAVIDECARIWEESSRQLQALCDLHGIRYVHCLQPTLHDPGGKTPTPEELRLGATPSDWPPVIQQGYPKLRERGAALAAAGIEFVDLSGLFAGAQQTLYIDICHFTDEGNAELAAAIARVVLAQAPAAAPPAPEPRAGKRKRARDDAK